MNEVPKRWPSAVIDNNIIYVIGGYDTASGVMGGFQKYDISNNTWTNLPTTGFTARERVASVLLDGKIYTFGGDKAAGQPDNNTNVVEIYDISANSWSSGIPMDVSACHMSAVTLNDKIYVIGGSIDTGPREQAKVDTDILTIKEYNLGDSGIRRYDTNADTWSTINVSSGNFYNREKSFIGAVDKKIYIIGGDDPPISRAYFDIHTFSNNNDPSGGDISNNILTIDGSNDEYASLHTSVPGIGSGASSWGTGDFEFSCSEFLNLFAAAFNPYG